MSLRYIQHRFNKVLSIYSKYPCNTNDKVAFKIAADRLLTFQLCLSVNIQGLISSAIRLPWFCSLSVKYIVCGNVNHLAVKLFANLCNIFCPSGIDSTNLSHLILIFCKIYRSPCSTVDHNIRSAFCENFFYCFFICNI